MHFDAIFIGLICKFLFIKKDFYYVIHTDLVGYYHSSSNLKKIFLYFILTLLKDCLFIFVSKEAELKAKYFFKIKKTCTIFNSMSMPIINNKVKSNKIFKFGCIARLDSSKNIDLIIRTFDSFWIKNNMCQLIIFGSGPEEINLKNYIKKFHCKDSIIFKGYELNKEIIYKNINALISFSSLEGFSLVIIEALSYNLPILHSDCSCGPREIMAPNSNPLYKTKKFDQLSSGILVKSPINSNPYNLFLDKNEIIYLDALKIFYDYYCIGENFEGENLEKFGNETIAQQWINLMFDLHKNIMS